MGEEIQFSEREKQVIELLIQGKSNKQIALSLGVSVRAIEFHLSNIYAKLGVSSRIEAALKLSRTPLRESTNDILRESAGIETDQPGHNVGRSISMQRIPIDKSFFAKLVFLLLLIVICVVAMIMMALQRELGQQVIAQLASILIPISSSQVCVQTTFGLLNKTKPKESQVKLLQRPQTKRMR